ncbi:unnamed protein product [Ambrosiozyma monospora]|uniref:Unnamed protein product n=1 Tax=Ambrosiozyma monospora TaxID=43982 RepID=A0ACB5UCE3_AMBMO|nr:unnamed protein product [Ambrosiozyma monospora]
MGPDGRPISRSQFPKAMYASGGGIIPSTNSSEPSTTESSQVSINVSKNPHRHTTNHHRKQESQARPQTEPQTTQPKRQFSIARPRSMNAGGIMHSLSVDFGNLNRCSSLISLVGGGSNNGGVDLGALTPFLRQRQNSISRTGSRQYQMQLQLQHLGDPHRCISLDPSKLTRGLSVGSHEPSMNAVVPILIDQERVQHQRRAQSITGGR